MVESIKLPDLPDLLAERGLLAAAEGSRAPRGGEDEPPAKAKPKNKWAVAKPAERSSRGRLTAAGSRKAGMP